MAKMDDAFDAAIDHLLNRDPQAPGNFCCRVRHASQNFPETFVEELASLMIRHRVTRVLAAVRLDEPKAPHGASR